MSPWTNSMSGALARATSIICRDSSKPVTPKPASASAAAWRPVPQPASTIRLRPASSRAASASCGAPGLGTTRSYAQANVV
jgi:hypothetical protein